MERRSRKKSSSAGSEKMERVGEIGKIGEVLFDRPKATASCSANGRRIIIIPKVQMPCVSNNNNNNNNVSQEIR
jgi:hypothetical protein